MNKIKEHNNDLYIILLTLSRNIYFYNKIELKDTFETRIYLMFIHFSILLIIAKKKNYKFDQKKYDFFFFSIENDLRELGHGDVAVNKKMKELNKIFYDILLKLDLEKNNNNSFLFNSSIIKIYFDYLDDGKEKKIAYLKDYFINFFNFFFDKSPENMIDNLKNFKF